MKRRIPLVCGLLLVLLLPAWINGQSSSTPSGAESTPADTIKITLEYPALEGDFYAVGTFSFPPFAAASPDNIKIVSGRGERSCRIRVMESWPDGSVMRAEIIFAANPANPEKFLLVYGGDTAGKKRFAQTAVLPTVNVFAEGMSRSGEAMDMDVGQLNVRVDASPGIAYYWHIIPIILVLLLLFIRARRAGRTA